MKPQCGVDSNLYRQFNFETHLWSMTDGNNMLNFPQDYLELAQRAVRVKSAYMLKIPNSTVWAEIDSELYAKRYAYNTWIGTTLSSGTVITAQMIDSFFTGKELNTDSNGKIYPVQIGSCPILHGKVSIPLGPRFINYNDKECFNEDKTNILIGDETHVNEDAMSLIRLIYRSLCNGTELYNDSFQESTCLLEQILTNSVSQLEFRFIMNWIAAIWQRPGINLQTNLWVVGQQNGVGKGTIAEVMKTILGDGAVGPVDKQQIEKGWNASLMGKLIVLVDEFATSDRRGGWSQQQWVDWIKETTCEPKLKITRKGYDTNDLINISNYYLMGNNEIPLDKFDASDRRNVFIKTTDDPIWKPEATRMRAIQYEPNSRWLNMCKGFAWILEQMQVDYALLVEAPITEHKREVLNESKSVVRKWLEEDISDTDQDRWMQSKELFTRFNNWVIDCKVDYDISIQKFGLEMKPYFRTWDKDKEMFTDMERPGILGVRIVGKTTSFAFTCDPMTFVLSEKTSNVIPSSALERARKALAVKK